MLLKRQRGKGGLEIEHFIMWNQPSISFEYLCCPWETRLLKTLFSFSPKVLYMVATHVTSIGKGGW